MTGIIFIRNNEVIKEKVNHKNNVMKEVILQKGLVPNLLQFAKTKLSKGDKIEKHLHESMIEVFYVLTGELLVIEDEIKTKVFPGDTFVIYPRQNHSLVSVKDTEIIYFGIEMKMTGKGSSHS